MSGGVLYISYSGMLEPLGQSQVLAYQERLAADREVHLLSFERASDWSNTAEREAIAERIATAGIHWHPRRYHKRPSALATAWDIGVGILSGLWVVLRYRVRIVHARSYIPSVMALALKRLTGAKFVFDMRGFWADERVDGGLWPRDGRMYRVAKWFERRFLRNADHVVSLTRAAVTEMERFDYLQGNMPPVAVIPTCADLERFRPLSGEYSVARPFTLGYVGSAGTWYMFEAVCACVAQLFRRCPNARFLVINRNEHEYIRSCLQDAGISSRQVEIRSATHAEVPAQMACMDASVFFIKPVFSKQASAPTKLGEFLGCGIPCLSNHGVGDMAEVLEGECVGVAVSAFDDEALVDGLCRLRALVAEPGIKERCMTAARKHFSLDEGVERYRAVYRSLEFDS